MSKTQWGIVALAGIFAYTIHTIIDNIIANAQAFEEANQ